MTFDAFETSTEGSQPIETFEFVLGAEVFRFTSAEDDVTFGGNTYTASTIQRSSTSQSGEDRDNVVEIVVPASNAFATKYINVVPAARAFVTIQRVQRQDFPTPEVVLLFQGLVQSVTFGRNARQATIAVLPLTSARSRNIPRFTFQAQCNHVHYDAGCTLLKSNFTFSSTVSGVSGNTVTVVGASGFADDTFRAGEAVLTNGDRRLVLDHVGDVLTLLLPFASNPSGQSIDLIQGCRHTITDCNDRFNNVVNFGGFKFVPTRNIFSDGLV